MMKYVLMLFSVILVNQNQTAQTIKQDAILKEINFYCDNFPYYKIPFCPDSSYVLLVVFDVMDDTCVLGISDLRADMEYSEAKPTHSFKVGNTIVLLRFNDENQYNLIEGLTFNNLIYPDSETEILNKLEKVGEDYSRSDVNMISWFKSGKLIKHIIYKDSIWFPWQKYYKIHKYAEEY